MRCCCCNRNLNDYESTLKSVNTGDYLDMCITCLDGLDIETDARQDLSPWEEYPGEWDDNIGEDEDE